MVVRAMLTLLCPIRDSLRPSSTRDLIKLTKTISLGLGETANDPRNLGIQSDGVVISRQGIRGADKAA
jgi:hypothetical protein